jgi:hypothetical protein
MFWSKEWLLILLTWLTSVTCLVVLDRNERCNYITKLGKCLNFQIRNKKLEIRQVRPVRQVRHASQVKNVRQVNQIKVSLPRCVSLLSQSPIAIFNPGKYGVRFKVRPG